MCNAIVDVTKEILEMIFLIDDLSIDECRLYYIYSTISGGGDPHVYIRLAQ